MDSCLEHHIGEKKEVLVHTSNFFFSSTRKKERNASFVNNITTTICVIVDPNKCITSYRPPWWISVGVKSLCIFSWESLVPCNMVAKFLGEYDILSTLCVRILFTTSIYLVLCNKYLGKSEEKMTTTLLPKW